MLLDEAHLLPHWAARLKGERDRLRRRGAPVHVVATGSSALRITAGSKEGLAGRFERITVSHRSAASLTDVFGMAGGAALRDLCAGSVSAPLLPVRPRLLRHKSFYYDLNSV